MRDCMNCINHSKDGCKVWKCDFKSIEDYKNEFTISVLEKIKADIKDVLSINNERDMLLPASYICKLVDKHISELKGE